MSICYIAICFQQPGDWSSQAVPRRDGSHLLPSVEADPTSRGPLGQRRQDGLAQVLQDHRAQDEGRLPGGQQHEPQGWKFSFFLLQTTSVVLFLSGKYLVLGRKPLLNALMLHIPQPLFAIIPVSSALIALRSFGVLSW